MNQYPKYSTSNKIGSLAVTHIRLFFQEKGWLFRESDGSTDFGIDAEIEIVDANNVTGKLFKCQIKGSGKIQFEESFYPVSIKTSTWNNWKNINIPVVALLCNVESKNIYWCLPLAFEPKENADSITLRFHQANSLGSAFREFQAIIDTWLKSFPKYNILLTIPFYHNLYENKLKSLIASGDSWCNVGEEINLETRIFYEHVLELRSSVGLTNESVFPFEFWLIRNQGMCGDAMMLFHSTYSELMTYVSPFYLEGMEKLKNRLSKVDPTFENNELMNYFKLDPLMRNNEGEIRHNVSVQYSHPYGNDRKFHSMIESTLEEMGYSPYKWQPKTK